MAPPKRKERSESEPDEFGNELKMSNKKAKSGHESENRDSPKTPSRFSQNPPDNSDSTPDSTPPKQLKIEEVNGKEGIQKCLSAFVEEESKKYIQKLNSAVDSSDDQSVEELAISGVKLSRHAEKIKELGQRFLSISEDRYKYKRLYNRPRLSDQ